MIRFRVYLIVSTLALTLLCCAEQVVAQSAPKVGKVEGVVLSQSGHRLSGATVYWKRSLTGTTVVQGATDTLGRFAFAVPITGITNTNTVYLFVNANAYTPLHAAVSVSSGGDTRHNLVVAPVAASKLATVHGKVTNARTRTGVSGADVSILNAGAVLHAVTDSTGAYSIPHVGFQSGLQIRMVTNREADTLRSSPCLTPIERSLSVSQSVVVQNFASLPANTYSPDCPTEIATPGASPLPASEISPEPPLTNDSSLFWHQADSLSILLGATNDIWNSGHINSILVPDTNTGLVVGSDTGGVWLITSNQQAISVSSTWDSVNISSLSAGPGGGGHVYASTWGSGRSDHPAVQPGVLWETDTSSVAPLLNWSHVSPQPPCGSINKVLAIPEVNRVVVACDFGIWWSNIPPSPSVKGTYSWAAATLAAGSPPLPTMNFSGLAKGPTVAGTGVASIAATTNGGNSPQQLIYHGEWVSGNLVLTPGSITGTAKQFGRSSIASCGANPAVQYAIAADGNNDNLGGVWVSTDGGSTWTPRSVPDAGNQGWYNQDVAVSPVNCNTMAIGFRNVGGLLSFNAGISFAAPKGNPAGEHSDIHAMLFDPFDPNTLWEGSDGGLLAIHGINGTPTYQSNFNRQILDLQMYHAVASTEKNELVAVSLQDNGTDDSILSPSGPGSWEQQVDSDGSYSEFVTPGSMPPGNDILIRTENCCAGANWSSALWNGTAFQPGVVIPVADAKNARDPVGISRGPVTRVHAPIFSNAANQLMFAAAGLGSQVFGLFANDDGSDLHWEFIGAVPSTENVSSLSSFNGNLVLVGTDAAHIFELDQPFLGAATQLQVKNPAGSARVTSIVEFVPTISFATLDSGYVLGWNGTTWKALGGGTLPKSQPFNAILLIDVNHLIAMTPTSIYLSRDLGTTWATANNGLPKIPQGQDLRFTIEPDGVPFIYMATYGRSLWRTVFRP